MADRVVCATATLLLGILLLMPGAAAAQATGAAEEEAVLGAVQRLFDIMAERDTAAARQLLVPDGRFVVVRVGAGGDADGIRLMDHDDFVGLLGAGSEPLLERMWSPEVRLHGSIAMVWTPYDFYRDGEFSHCGVDAFTLVKMDEGWRIAGATYTIQTEGCEPSPLGPAFPDGDAGLTDADEG